MITVGHSSAECHVHSGLVAALYAALPPPVVKQARVSAFYLRPGNVGSMLALSGA